MSGLFAGHVQRWGVSDCVIQVVGRKARPRALCAWGLGCSLKMPHSRDGASFLPACH